MGKQTLGIYVHIPFCKSKCGYCDFCSHTPVGKTETERYMNALLLNIQDFSASAGAYTVDTVYIGGGTPSLLEPKQLRSLTDCIFSSYRVERGAEITMEANPGTVDKSYLKAARRAGINRISFGLQSASDRELKALGRIHDRAAFAESYRAARAAGFDNINVDLMYGIPMQTEASFSKTLDFVISAAPEHISVYGLKIEEGTRFAAERENLDLPDEESEYNMYIAADSKLELGGYRHYEISNFARPGFESRHNLRYWKDELYLGFGVSAHSYFGNQRYAYTDDMDAYIKEMELPNDMSAVLSECTDIDIFTRETEYVMLRLRLFEGLSFSEYRERFDRDFLAKYGEKLKKYREGGFLEVDSTHCAFTLKGMYVSNYILSDILEF